MVKTILSEEEEMEVIGEVEDGLSLLKFLVDSSVLPDLAIIDVSMPKLQGIEAARRIKKLFPGIKVLLLTVHREREYVSQAFLAGAEGYLLKEEANVGLIAAIDSIRHGRVYKSTFVNNSVH
jgi:DNA-binding NarL/FixJ family response regulator